MLKINSHVKGFFELLGLDIRLIRNIETSQKKEWETKWTEQWRFLQKCDVRTIIDIGANTGQFATMIHRVCPLAKIISFEPLKDCFKELQSNLGGLPNVDVCNFALGDDDGAVEINRSNFRPSSSVLEMGDLHKRDWPESVAHSKELIQMRRLDGVLSNDRLAPELLVKIDVQGYELNVIRGGRRVLSRTSVAVIEVSFRELYEGQPLFEDINRAMTDLGFRYIGNVEQYASKIDGQILFADAIFENAQHRCL